MATCPVTARKVRNATTVRQVHPWRHLSPLTNNNRWRTRASEPGLPFRTFFGARLLQVQATRTRSGGLSQLSSPRPLYSPGTWIITFFSSHNSDCIARLAAIEGDSCEGSTILVFLISGIHALTILYPSIEGNLGGDIEGRRAEMDGHGAVSNMLHSDGHSCMLN